MFVCLFVFIKLIQTVKRNFRLVKFWSVYCRHFNSMLTKFTKQKHLRVNKMWAERKCCMSVQPFIIQRFTSIIVVVRMLFDTLLALQLFYVHRIHCSRAKQFRKIMGPFLRNKHCQLGKKICNHGIGSNVNVLRVKKTGQHWISSARKLDWGSLAHYFKCTFPNKCTSSLIPIWTINLFADAQLKIAAIYLIIPLKRRKPLNVPNAKRWLI